MNHNLSSCHELSFNEDLQVEFPQRNEPDKLPFISGIPPVGRCSANSSYSEPLPAGQDAPHAPRHFPLGWPEQLTYFLNGMDQNSWLAGAPAQCQAALTGYVWNEAVLGDRLDQGEWFSVQMLVKASKELGLNLSYSVCRQGLRQLAGLHFFEFLNKEEYLKVPSKNLKKCRGRLADEWFQARPIFLALEDFLETVYCRVREQCFANLPDRLAVERAFGEDWLATLNKAIAAQGLGEKVVEAGARLEKRMGILRGRLSLDKLMDVPLLLPEGRTLSNLAQFRRAIIWAKVENSGGKTTEFARKLRQDAGVRSKQSLQNICRDEDILSVPRFQEYEIDPTQPVLPQMEGYNLKALGKRWACELHSSGGDVKVVYDRYVKQDYDEWVQAQAAAGHQVAFAVRLSSLRRFRTEEDLLTQAQSKRRRRPRRHTGGRVKANAPVAAIVPAGFSADYLLEQTLQFLPDLYKERDVRRITNSRTGEILTWEEACEQLRAERGSNINPWHAVQSN